MASLWIIFVLFGSHGIVSCQRDAGECYEDMQRDSDISHLLLDVTSPERIDYFCGRISRLKKCVADYEDQLSNAENTEYLQKARGITTFYLNVCPPGTDITQRYKGNAPCFQLIKHQILSCGSDLPDMSSYEMQKDLNSRCCALSHHRKCVTSAASEHCGKEAGQVVNEILFRYFETQLEGCWKKQECANESDDSWTTDEAPGRRITAPERRAYHTTPKYFNGHDSRNESIRFMNSLLNILSSVLIVLLQFVLPQ
ncbi:uncharacterized protein TNCT_110701 [Trichonephila clavata]|uniref:Uncharacterized protein n=1 Tax=Trichonephila clavata TaxID=2740835 RepID=A0A8X6L6B5_TRICU|nr:uncharacterized protein TNCT_110701 [Trichonephila clavata]